MKPIAMLMLLLLSGTAMAQPVRTWVSVNGSDTNDCTRNAPCRNFEAAVAEVSEGGEVVVLDSGGFGSVLIDKGVTLLAPEGIHAAIAPTSGTAIGVTSAAGLVSLRNLYLNSQGAQTGIGYAGLIGLNVSDCVANGFGFEGFISSSGAQGNVQVTNSEFRNNGSHGFQYVGLTPGRVVIDSSRFEGNEFDGMSMSGNAAITVRDSVSFSNGRHGFALLVGNGLKGTLIGCLANGNTMSGFIASNPFSSSALTMHLQGCTASGNGTGVQAASGSGGSSDIYVAGSTIVYNGVGISQTLGAAVHSRVNNTVENNGLFNSFTAPAFLAK